MTDARQTWAEYWQEGRADGEVFVDAEGRRHPALADYWQSIFETLPESARIIDIACGAGSVMSHLPDGHGHELTAADLSPEALAILAQRIPAASTIVCSADTIPCPDQSFDLVVSQFGIEYATVDAFGEAARLVAAGGSFAALAHVEDGYLDAPNRLQLAAAVEVRELQFIDLGIDLINAVHAGDAQAIERAKNGFTAATQQLETTLEQCPEGVHAHLYQGFRQLYERRSRYLPQDITSWLDSMRAEVDKAILRLSAMRRAALSANDIELISERLSEAGLKSITIKRFFAPQHSDPLAWDIRARRAD